MPQPKGWSCCAVQCSAVQRGWVALHAPNLIKSSPVMSAGVRCCFAVGEDCGPEGALDNGGCTGGARGVLCRLVGGRGFEGCSGAEDRGGLLRSGRGLQAGAEVSRNRHESQRAYKSKALVVTPVMHIPSRGVAAGACQGGSATMCGAAGQCGVLPWISWCGPGAAD